MQPSFSEGVMTKIQWSVFGIAILIAAGLYAASENQFFGNSKISKAKPETVNAQPALSTDAILNQEKSSSHPHKLPGLIFWSTAFPEVM